MKRFMMMIGLITLVGLMGANLFAAGSPYFNTAGDGTVNFNGGDSGKSVTHYYNFPNALILYRDFTATAFIQWETGKKGLYGLAFCGGWDNTVIEYQFVMCANKQCALIKIDADNKLSKLADWKPIHSAKVGFNKIEVTFTGNKIVCSINDYQEIAVLDGPSPKNISINSPEGIIYSLPYSAEFIADDGVTCSGNRFSFIPRVNTEENFVNIGGDLLSTIKSDNSKAVKTMVDNHCDVNVKDSNDNTALMYAVQQGNVEIVKLLIDAKADVNVKNKSGATALLYAAFNKKPEILQVLITAHADVNVKDAANGATPLMYAAESGNLEIAKLLLAAKADVNAVDLNGNTALIRASQKGNAEIVKVLIGAKADVNAKNKSGYSPLFAAINAKALETLKTLIASHADVNTKDPSGGVTPMIYAVQNNNLEALQLLINAQADINARDINGITALMVAAYNGSVDAVKLLIAAGANTNIVDNFGKTAMNYANERQFPDIANLLKNAGNVRPDESKTSLQKGKGTPSSTAPKKLAIPDYDHFKTQDSLTRFEGGIEEVFSWDRAAWINPDFSARVLARWDGGLADCFGIVFRQTDDLNFYVFEIHPGGYFRLAKVVKGQWEYPADWRKTNLLKEGFNELQVQCEGASIICSLNGSPVIDISEASSSNAKVGIGVGVYSKVKCSFKDLEIMDNNYASSSSKNNS